MGKGTFQALGASAAIERALADGGIESPFPIQELVIPDALDGHDVLAKSPTGSGKTLAFAIPLLERMRPGRGRPVALVLVPTRELATQVGTVIAPLADAKGARVAVVHGGVPLEKQAQLARKADIVVATPGRLHDLMQRKLLSLDAVTALVLDEADRMLDLGFRPQVERIMKRLPTERQTLLFSATLDGQVGELARSYTTDASRFESVAPLGMSDEELAEDVDHRFIAVEPGGKVDVLVKELAADRGLALVFVRTRRGADRLVRMLRERGIPAEGLHGDMTQGARDKALARFGAGKVTTLIATDVAARGLDLDDITHVINYDPPAVHSDYVHRVGRTGRAGRGGTGVTLVLPDQEADVSRVADRLGYREHFERGGLRTAPPRKVYQTRRKRSRW